MGVELNRQGLADHMGVSLPTIDTFRKEGMPTRGKSGVQWVFDLSDCIKWYVARQIAAAGADVPDDMAAIDKRTAVAKMELGELAAAKAKGQVATIRDFERAQAAVFAEIRTNVMNVPQRVVIQLLGETNETIFKEKLKAELALALKAAAEAPLTLAEEDDEAAEE
jgi:phage terminase Nu1 subunit (DNA packaging protein)